MAEWGYPLLTDAQYIPMVIVGTLSSCLSLLGSGCILYMSFRQRDKVLHRLLFLLSSADLMSSVAFLSMPYAIPSSIGLPGAVGTHATCTAAGFFLMFGVQYGCYQNGAVSMYYYLVVVRSWRENDFQTRRWLEIVLQLLGFAWCLAINVYPAVTQSINPYEYINNLCILSSFPWNCGDDKSKGELPCERSTQATIDVLNPPHFFYVIIFTLMGFACTLRVWYHVYQTRKRSAAYSMARISSQQPSSSDPPKRRSWFASRSQASSNNNPPDLVLRQVCQQAILYFLVYFNTFLWPFLGILLSQALTTPQEMQEKKTQPGWYMLQLLYWTFAPLAGFLNFFVYTRLKVQQLKRSNPQRSLWSIYREIILNTSAIPQGGLGSNHSSKNRASTKATGQPTTTSLPTAKSAPARPPSDTHFADEGEPDEEEKEEEVTFHNDDPEPNTPSAAVHSDNENASEGACFLDEEVAEEDDKSNPPP